jgi:hypothetical protein
MMFDSWNTYLASKFLKSIRKADSLQVGVPPYTPLRTSAFPAPKPLVLKRANEIAKTFSLTSCTLPMFEVESEIPERFPDIPTPHIERTRNLSEDFLML